MNQQLLSKLASDGFVEIGRFRIAEQVFTYDLTLSAAADWVWSLYAWVSTQDSGTVLRIGKCEGRLAIRIAAYKRSLNDVMGRGLAANQCFKGDTTPRERQGWIDNSSGPDGGRIFARQLGPLPTRDVGKILLKLSERELIGAYDPPLCNDSASGRRLQREWLAKRGPITRIGKRRPG